MQKIKCHFETVQANFKHKLQQEKGMRTQQPHHVASSKRLWNYTIIPSIPTAEANGLVLEWKHLLNIF